MTIQSKVPTAITSKKNDPLNTGNVTYNPYTPQIQDNDIGTEIQKTFYLWKNQWGKEIPNNYERKTVSATNNNSEETALYLGAFTASGEPYGAVIKRLKNIIFSIITVPISSGQSIRPVFKYEISVDGEEKGSGVFDYGQTSSSDPTIVQWTTDNVDKNEGKDIIIKLWAWCYKDVNTTTESFYVYFGEYHNNDDFYTTATFDFIGLYEKDFNFLFDVIGTQQKDFHFLFDIVDDTQQKDFHFLFDIKGSSLAQDEEVINILVNNKEINKSQIGNLSIEQVAYTPEARQRPYLYMLFKSPIEFNLGDLFEVKSRYSLFKAYITRKSPGIKGIYSYEAYSPKEHRLLVHDEIENAARTENVNMILGHDGKLWKINNNSLLSIQDSDVMLTDNVFDTFVTNVQAPDKLYGLWKPDVYPWYNGKELCNRFFDEANGTQYLTNNSFQKDSGASVVLKNFPSNTAMIIRNLNKDIFAKAVSYISVRFTTTNWNEWTRNDDFIRIRIEGEDEDGNFRFGDIRAQIPYRQRQGENLLELGWNGTSWTTFGGYLNNGLNNSFSSNDESLQWWIKKIIIIIWPLSGNVTFDSLFIQGRGIAKNYVGSGENSATVNLKSVEYNNAMKELETTFEKTQVQKGYRFSIPLRLSFAPPFWFTYKGEKLKVFKVKHDLTSHITTFEVGTGIPTLVGGMR